MTTSSFLVLFGASAHAQDSGVYLDEVVTTAQKRTQSTQDVPVTVNALPASTIEKAAVTNVDGIVNLIPGLNSRSDGPTQTVFAVRGIGTNAFGVGVDASVGVFIDDVYTGHPVLANAAFFDVERVEVVKGPQGTLFGRNTSAGAISVISKKAEIGQSYADLKVGFGNDGQQLYQGIANFSTGDTGAVRISGKYEKADGPFENGFTGNELNGKDGYQIRASLNQELSDRLRLNLVGEVSAEDSYYGLIAIDTADRETIPETVYQAAREDVDVRTMRLAANLEYDVSDNVTLTSITSYLDIESVTTPNDFSLASFSPAIDDVTFAGGPDDFPLAVLPFREPGEFSLFSQELRLNGSGDKIDWFVGASYNRDNLFNDTSLVGYDDDVIAGLFFGAADCASAATDLAVNPAVCNSAAEEHSPADVDSESMGIYGDFTYDVSDKFHVTLGGRLSHDKKTMDLDVQASTGLLGALGTAIVKPIVGMGMGSESWTQFSPRVALDYQFNSDVMAYASYNKGYKAGGFNSSLDENGDLVVVDPETNNAYEIGIKSDLGGGRARLNAAAFYSDYSNFQVEIQNGASFNILNVADATVKGFEVEGTFMATEGLQLQLAYTYLDTEQKNAAATATSGEELPFAPENAFTAVANYDFDIGLGEVNIQASYNYTDKQWNTVFASQSPDLFSDSHESLDARIGLTSADDRWSIALLGQNLTGDRYFISTNDILGGVPIGLPNTDTRYRVELGVKF